MSLVLFAPRCELLHQIPQHLLVRLDPLSETRSYSAGETLFTEGSRNSDFHIVVDGSVRLDMLVPVRGRVPILTAGTGDILAWSALLGTSVMTATAVAMTPVKTVTLRGSELRILCEAEPELGYYVMQQLASAVSKRLVATRLQLLDLFAQHEPI